VSVKVFARLGPVVHHLLDGSWLRGGSVYVGVQVAQAGITLLFIALYAQTMPPSEYGLIATYTSVSTLCGLVLYLSLRERAYFAIAAAEPDARLTVSSIVRFMIMIAALVLPVTLAAAWFFRHETVAGLPLFPHAFCAQISATGLLLVSTLSLTLQAAERIGRGAIVTFVAFLAFSATNICVLLLRGMDSASYVYAHASAYGVAGVLACLYLLRKHGPHISWSHVRSALRFSIPLVAHNTAHWARVYVDRIILSSALTTAATGVYGIAVAYCSVPPLVVEAFALSFTPRFFRLVQDPANYAKLCSVLPVSVGIVSAATTLMSLFANEVIRLVAAPEYWTAAAYVPLLCTAIVLYVIYVNLVVVLMYKKRTGVASAATVGSCLIGVGSAIALLPSMGIWAMPIGLVLLNACMVIFVALAAQRELRLPWPWFSTITFCALPALAYAHLGDEIVLTRRILMAAAILAFIALLIRPHVKALRQHGARGATPAAG
jgi:O-antigen/teichoic acid export membrane protein